jgi:antitoxin PrlF
MEATLTVKGQITLPKALRNALHLKTGDKLVFEELEGGAYVIRPQSDSNITDVQTLKGCVSYQGKSKTIQEMQDAIVENMRESS